MRTCLVQPVFAGFSMGNQRPSFFMQWRLVRLPIHYNWATSWLNQQHGMCIQQKLRSARASARSDQSSLSPWRKLGSFDTDWVQIDQTGQTPRLIWVFARHKGHFVGFVMWQLISVITSDMTRYGWDNKWAAARQYQQNDPCSQWRLRSACASAQTDQSSLFAWWNLESLAILWANKNDWSDWADAQADPSLHRMHRSFCWFCHAATKIVLLRIVVRSLYEAAALVKWFKRSITASVQTQLWVCVGLQLAM